MRNEIKKEIEFRQTYRCKTCGDFIYENGNTPLIVRCPICGERAVRPRISTRKTSYSSYLFRYMPLFLVDRINKPLQNVIIMLAKRVDITPTKGNTSSRLIHTLLDIKKRMFEHYLLPGRKNFLESAWTLFLYKIIVDRHYRTLFHWLVMEIVKEVLLGNIPLREVTDIDWDYWDESPKSIEDFKKLMCDWSFWFIKRNGENDFTDGVLFYERDYPNGSDYSAIFLRGV